MNTQHKIKQGFENKGDNYSSLTIKLSIMAENIEMKDIGRLVNAIDKEYEQIVQEKCGLSKRGFKEWRMVFG